MIFSPRNIILQRSLLASILFSFLMSLQSAYAQSAPLELDADYIASVDRIVMAHIEPEYSVKGYLFVVDTVFKSSPENVSYFAIDFGTGTDFAEDEYYLIFANVPDKHKLTKFELQRAIGSGRGVEWELELQKLKELIPCAGEPDTLIAACPRIREPVCGCNGQEYGNSCDARREGIYVYFPGPCEK